MIRHVLLSENEAFKLKAFIERARLFMPNIEFQILISASGIHEQAYDMVIDELSIQRRDETNKTGAIILKDGNSFHGELLALLEEGNEEFACLITTDDMLFADVDELLIEKEFEDKGLFSFALRLGKNITKNSMVRMSNKVIPISENNHTMKWDWTKHYVDFSAPLSVHGHYFRKNDIYKMIRSCKGVSTFAELEDSLQKFMNFPKPFMASFVQSKAVSINPIFEPSLAQYVKDGLDSHILKHGSISVVTDYSLTLPDELHAPLLEHEIRSALK